MMVQDRKTGEWYDPDAKFQELMDQPSFKDQLIRMRKRDQSHKAVAKAQRKTQVDLSKATYSIKYRKRNVSTGYVETLLDEFSMVKAKSDDELERYAKSVFGQNIEIVTIKCW